MPEAPNQPSTTHRPVAARTRRLLAVESVARFLLMRYDQLRPEGQTTPELEALRLVLDGEPVRDTAWLEDAMRLADAFAQASHATGVDADISGATDAARVALHAHLAAALEPAALGEDDTAHADARPVSVCPDVKGFVSGGHMRAVIERVGLPKIERAKPVDIVRKEPNLPAQGPVADRGPWVAGRWSGGRVVLQSDDFKHDVALIVDGDFADDEQKMDYAKRLATQFNAGAVPAVGVA